MTVAWPLDLDRDEAPEGADLTFFCWYYRDFRSCPCGHAVCGWVGW
jgi:hypothetical protein